MTKEFLNELFEYREGMLFYKIKPCRNISVGERAGATLNTGYRHINIRYKLHYEHHLIWIMFYGEMPAGKVIDHKDNNPSNNKIDNLRVATLCQNAWNSRLSKNNTSGFKGVSFATQKRKWKAQIIANGVKRNLGYFSTPELASEAYKRHANILHGDFVNN